MTPEALFDAIEATILEEPKRIRMSDWAFNPSELLPDEMPACGTVGCIAGWACAIASGARGEAFFRHRRDCWNTARQLLELTEQESCQLFFVNSWPQTWSDRLYARAPGTKPYAKVVVAYLRFWREAHRPVVVNGS